jgi:hypothetical protein
METETNQPIDIISASRDRTLLSVEHSPAQAALLKGIYRLAMDVEEKAFFEEATGRKELDLPVEPSKVVYGICGRRGGKSRTAATIGVFEGCLAEHEIPENEIGVVTILGPTERQARTTFKVVQRMIERSPKLRGMIVSIRQSGSENEILLSNNRAIRVEAANQRTVRGSLIVCAIIEESCFLRDSVSGEYNLEEILDALTPSLLTLPDSKLILISSPWATVGPVWEAYKNRAQRPNELVFKLPSWRMNPSLSPELLWLERQRMGDQKYNREYGAEFSDAVSQLIPSDLIDKAVVPGVRETRTEKPEQPAVLALDPASKGTDAFAYAIAHRCDDGRVKLDLAKQFKSPGNGQYIDFGRVVPSIIEEANQFQAMQVYSDQICAAALAAMFSQKGFRFNQISTFGTKAQELYRTVRQLFVAGKVILPDNPELTTQLKALQEVLAEGGRSVVQAKTGHDDLAVAACLAIYESSFLPQSFEPICGVLWIADRAANTNNWQEDRFFRSRESRTPSFSR